MVEEGDEEEGYRVDQGGAALLGGEGRHNLGAGLADELTDRDDLVAAGAKSLDKDGEGGYGGGAVAAAVVHEDDRAAHPGLGLGFIDLVEDGVDDLPGCFAGVLVPVVGVDLVADDDVAVGFDVLNGGGLVVGVRLLVDGVGRAEVDGLDA